MPSGGRRSSDAKWWTRTGRIRALRFICRHATVHPRCLQDAAHALPRHTSEIELTSHRFCILAGELSVLDFQSYRRTAATRSRNVRICISDHVIRSATAGGGLSLSHSTVPSARRPALVLNLILK